MPFPGIRQIEISRARTQAGLAFLDLQARYATQVHFVRTIVLTSRGPGNDITHATVDHGAAATLIIPLQPGEALLLRAEDKTDISDFHRSPSEHGYRFRML